MASDAPWGNLPWTSVTVGGLPPSPYGEERLRALTVGSLTGDCGWLASKGTRKRKREGP